jgi:hypothetical protein
VNKVKKKCQIVLTWMKKFDIDSVMSNKLNNIKGNILWQ